jgi:hypothetical protein
MQLKPTGNFFSDRWQRRLPAAGVLLRDMCLVGTGVNLLASVLALALLAADGPAWAALLVHMAPLPYNLFLLLALTRAAGCSAAQELLGLLWFVAMVLL